MKKLSTLFKTCVTIEYDTIGTDVNYKFMEDKDTLYIYFQGSSSDIDWKRNFAFWKKPYKDMESPYRVHSGFLKAWKEVEDIVIAKITETKDNCEPKFNKIIVVGYSHGAALAAFCHECCWFHRPDLQKVNEAILGYGFEAPRIYAGFKVKDYLQERWTNFTVIRNHTDLVTHMPPRLFGFCHVGNLKQIGRKAKYSCIKSHYPDNVLNSLLEDEK